MMDHLERIGATAHGIFRRPGGKVRTQALREQIENDLSKTLRDSSRVFPNDTFFTSSQSYLVWSTLEN